MTVGMRVYNDPAGVRRSVPTVFGQTWDGPVRLLVVDDGSTDDTSDVLAAFAERYRGIEIVRNEQNQGRSAARNKVLESAGDDYLAWIDAGDLWHPRKLEVQLGALLETQRAQRDGSPLVCVGPFRLYVSDLGVGRIRYPEVEGDQLYNALRGRLFPHLQAVIGPTESFRRIGGFDQQLKYCQGYDFLVRFVANGGRVVASREDVPVFTYCASDVDSSPKDVAAANRLLRRKHRLYYYKYGHAFTKLIHSNQHRLVARFYAHNRKRVRSTGYEALAVITSPRDAWRRTTRRLRWIHRLVRYIGRLPVKVLRPALPLLQRTEILEFAGKFGIFKLVARNGLSRRLLVDLKSEVEDGRGFSVLPRMRSGERPPEAERIEQEIHGAESSVHPDTWLRLEYAYRQHSLLHSAESALRRGLTQYPNSPELTVRLIELLAFRRKWSECAELWLASDGLGSQHLRALTYARVARSFRALGDIESAQQVAAAGIELWPDDYRVKDEFYVCRAARLDWKHAVNPASDGFEVGANGSVTDLGFLAGSSGPLTGRIAATGPQAVSLVVNGIPIATTYAVRGRPDDDRAHFSLICNEVLHYLGDGDTIWVECGGERLGLENDRTALAIHTGYPSRMRELERKLIRGHVFTKFGQLRMGNTPERRRHTLALFDQVSLLINGSHGYQTYPFYGHLLGAIREHDFIAHDAGGFDMGYVSEYSTPDDVRSEFMEILRMLIDHGYHLRVEPWSAYVRPTATSRVFVDLNYGWFTSTGELQLSYGWRHRPVTDTRWFATPRESLIGGRLIRVPGNAEDVLEQIYGPSWVVPDQGFEVSAEIQRNERAILTVDELMSIESIDPDRVVALFDHHPDVEGPSEE